MSHPWMKFYASDWRSDPGLRACSIAARGMWMEMLCLMWEATPKGSLLINGRQPAMKLLASLSGVSPKEAGGLVEELEGHGVFSRDEDGTAFSRRMRRDIEKAARDAANGRGGGNPNITGKRGRGVNPAVKPSATGRDNPTLNGGDKAQKPEARSQIIRGGQGSALPSQEVGTPPTPGAAAPAPDWDEHSPFGSDDDGEAAA